MTDILPGSALATAGIGAPDGVDVTIGPPRAILTAAVTAPQGIIGPRIFPGASAAVASVQGALGLITVGTGPAQGTASVQVPNPTTVLNRNVRTLLGVGI